MSTITVTKSTEDSKVKDKNKALKEATASGDLDTVLNNVKKVDFLCNYNKCKNKTKDFAIDCKYCSGRFCTTHGLPEVHGCGPAVCREEKKKFLHPGVKVGEERHNQAQLKLSMKLKQMQLERKAKQGSSNKGKKK